MSTITLADVAYIQAHGYNVERVTDAWGNAHPSCTGWHLTHDDGCGNGPARLMIADYGLTSPTKWEAVAEAHKRIAEEQSCEEAPIDVIPALTPDVLDTIRVSLIQTSTVFTGYLDDPNGDYFAGELWHIDRARRALGLED